MTQLQTFAKAFSDRKHGPVTCLVEDDGSILVWDNIAHAFTRCHSLSEQDSERIRQEASEMAPVKDRNKLLAALIREANPKAELPADADECVEACEHNVHQWYQLASRAAGGNVAALAALRAEMGLPVLR